MTLTECIQLCRGQGVTYAVIRGPDCSCVDVLPPHTNLSKSDCSIPCPGDPYQYCGEGGAATKAVIVNAKDGRVAAQSCEELQLIGIGDGQFELKPPQTSLVTQYCGVPECPHSWIKINGNCYKFNLNAMTAEDAQSVCAKYDAYPVVIETLDELDLIVTTIQNISIYKAKTIWRIGVQSLSKNGGLYRWANGRIFDISPLNNTFIKHEGLFMTINTTDPSIWQASQKKNTHLTFICEKGSEYMGCYNPTGIVSIHNITNYDQMTIQQCVEYCRDYGVPYAYLAPTDCMCSSSVAVPADPAVGTCTSVCGGQANQLCGGGGLMSLYNVSEYAPFATSCADLFDAGIFLSGSYIVNGTSTECHLKDGTICDDGWLGYNGDCYRYLPLNAQGPSSTCLIDGMGARLASLHTVQEYTFVVDYLKRRYIDNNKSDMTIYSGVSDVYELEVFMNADGSLLDLGLITEGHIEVAKLGLRRSDLLFNIADGLTLDDITGNAIGAMCKADKANRGCFVKPINIVPILDTLDWMETTLCKQLCLGQSMSLALIGEDSCICAETADLASFMSISSPDCYVQCNTFAGGYCGRGGVVWALVINADDVAADCNALYMTGVFHNGTYKLRNGTGYMLQTCGVSDATKCATTWLGKEGECYKFLIYNTTFTDAVGDCFSRDGYLFNPTNGSTVNAFVDDTLATLPFFDGFQRYRTGIMVAYYNTSFVTSDGQIIDIDYSTDNSSMLPVATVIYQTDITSSWTMGLNNEQLPYICQSNQDYYGCNTITSPSDDAIELTSGLSLTFCLEYCRGQDALYAATSPSMCNCYVILPTMANTPGNCTTACDDVTSQPCGGVDDSGGIFHSVFKIPTDRHVPESCDELFRYRIETPGWYYIQPPSSPKVKVYCFDNNPPLAALQASQIKSVKSSSTKDGLSTASAIYKFPMRDVWKPSVDQAGEFVKIVTVDDFIVTGLQIFGLHTASEQSWVSEMGVSYREHVTGKLEVYGTGNINANTNGIDGANVLFQNPFVTNEIVIHPKVWHTSISIRIRVLGQLFKAFDHVSTYVGCYADYGPNIPAGNATSLQICMDTCGSSGYPYASLDTGDSCTCVTTGFPYGRMAESNCPTLADSSRRGQTGSLALYRTYAMKCTTPPVLNITDGAVATTTFPYVDGVHTYGTSVTYVCDVGYEFNDVTTEGVIACLHTNEWSTFNKTCQIVTCPAFTVTNGATSITSLEYLGVATVTCDPGFWAPGSARDITVQCEANKTWTITPTCKVENFKATQRTFQNMGDKARAAAAMFDEQEARSMTDCAAKCTQSYYCRGANYQEPSGSGIFGTCRLFTDISDGNDLSDDIQWDYFESENIP